MIKNFLEKWNDFVEKNDRKLMLAGGLLFTGSAIISQQEGDILIAIMLYIAAIPGYVYYARGGQ